MFVCTIFALWCVFKVIILVCSTKTITFKMNLKPCGKHKHKWGKAIRRSSGLSSTPFSLSTHFLYPGKNKNIRKWRPLMTLRQSVFINCFFWFEKLLNLLTCRPYHKVQLQVLPASLHCVSWSCSFLLDCCNFWYKCKLQKCRWTSRTPSKWKRGCRGFVTLFQGQLRISEQISGSWGKCICKYIFKFYRIGSYSHIIFCWFQAQHNFR